MRRALVPPAPCIEKNMSDPLRAQSRGRPGTIALWTGSETWSYARLNRAVLATRQRLEARDVGFGDRVGVHLPNEPSCVILLWALWRCGAVAVPLSTRLPPHRVVEQAEAVDCDGVISSDAAVAERVRPNLFTVRPEDIVCHEGSADRRGIREQSRDRSATILFTSGSTGAPKAVLHTWANHLYSAKGANANVPLGPDDRWLLSLPLYHVGGLAILVRCALAGAAVAVPTTDAPLGDVVESTGATHLSLVSTQFRRLLTATKGAVPSQVRAVLLGGGPIPDALVRRAARQGWPLHTTYGCTEMASQVTTTPPGAPLADLQTAGRCLPHRHVCIVDGQICVAGATLFKGYVEDGGIRDPRTDDGWYPTGDRGTLDVSGRLHVKGRVDRMFVSGGENIQPEEIEGVLEQIEGVERAIIVPVSSDEYGKRPVAFVETSTEEALPSFAELLEQCLPGFKIPDAFHPFPEDRMSGRVHFDRDLLQKRAHMLREEKTLGEETE